MSALRATLILVIAALLSVACASPSPGATQQIWVEDNYVLCSEIDEPDRNCLLVGHKESGFYRHIEGPIEGFDYEEGTKYLLEVETLETSAFDDPPYRLVEILRADPKD